MNALEAIGARLGPPLEPSVDLSEVRTWLSSRRGFALHELPPLGVPIEEAMESPSLAILFRARIFGEAEWLRRWADGVGILPVRVIPPLRPGLGFGIAP